MSSLSTAAFTFVQRHAALVACAGALAFVVGCSKSSPEEQKKKEAELTSALTSAMATGTAAPGAAAPGAAAPGEFVGSCTDKESFLCNEWTGALPLGSEDSCKLMNGAFSKTDRCPADKLGKSPLAGVCTIKSEGDNRVKKSHAYLVNGTTLKASAESAKAMCDVQSGTFVAAAAPAAAAPAAKPKKK